MAGRPSRGALFALAAGVAAAALYGLLLRLRQGALVDDAFISFRYAARWAAGQGWTWNPGEAVEGFSNPLWTVLLGGVDRAGGPAPDRAAPILGLAFLWGTLALTASIVRARGGSRSVAAWCAGALALDVGFALWSGSGLEVALAGFMVAAFLRAAVRPNRRFVDGLGLGLLGAGLFLSRPEGVLWAAWGLAWLLWGAWVPWRTLAGTVVGAAPAWAYLAYRLARFGSPVANTFFAKMEPTFLGVPGAAGDVGMWAAQHAVPLALGLWGWAGRRVRGADAGGVPRWALLPAGWLVLQVLFVLAAGGDWMGRTRYLAPMLPAFYVLVAEAWAGRRAASVVAYPGLSRLAAGALLIVHLGAGWPGRDRIPTYTRDGRTLGLWLAEAAAPGDTVAVTAAGAIPYYSRLPALDVLGINDRAVRRRPARHTGTWAPGHHRYDVDQVLERRPAWIVWDFGVRVNRRRLRDLAFRGEPGTGETSPPLGYRQDLLARPEFTRLYAIDPSAPLATQDAYTVFRRR